MKKAKMGTDARNYEYNSLFYDFLRLLSLSTVSISFRPSVTFETCLASIFTRTSQAEHTVDHNHEISTFQHRDKTYRLYIIYYFTCSM